MPRVLMPLLAMLLAATPTAGQELNPNIRFGLPAPAKANPEASREAFLIERPQYVLSYNAKTRTPNWVAWRLREADIGTAARSAFEPDPAPVAPPRARQRRLLPDGELLAPEKNAW
jgi:endonuclease G, mitochondrial